MAELNGCWIRTNNKTVSIIKISKENLNWMVKADLFSKGKLETLNAALFLQGKSRFSRSFLLLKFRHVFTTEKLFALSGKSPEQTKLALV